MELFAQEYGSGRPLIILHGLLGSLDNWHSLSRRFSSSFHVFALDQRNHGRSPHSEEFTYEAMAADLREFFHHRAIPSAFVLGHSMGGKTAMRLALDNPELVEKLIVVDIGPKAYAARHDTILDALRSVDLHRVSSRNDAAEALASSIPSPATRQFLLKNLRRNDDGTFSWKMNLEVIHRNYSHVNEAIAAAHPFTKPSLFIRSTTAGYVTDEDRSGIAELFPAYKLIDVPVGHWIHAEAPDLFFASVMDFLTRGS